MSSAAAAGAAEHPVTVLGTANAVNNGVTPADTRGGQKVAFGGGCGSSFVGMGTNKPREKALA